MAEAQDVWRGDAPFAVRRDLVRMPDDDEPVGRVVLEHPGAVVILALDDDEQAFVLKQYRHPTLMRFVELPAGLLDQPGEDPEEAARRELLEEAALEAEHWRLLSTIHTSPGVSAERIEIFLATGLTAVPDRGGFELHHEEADMTAHWAPLSDLLAGVLDRTLTDGPLVTAVLAYEVMVRGARG